MNSTTFRKRMSGAALSAFLVSVALCSVGGCGDSSPEPEPETPATEVKAKGSTIVDTPESELLETSKRLYSSGLYSVAKDSFQQLKDTYPLGPYAELAELKVADCEFELHEYLTAAPMYEEFLKSHPSSSSTDYALLRMGRAQQLANKGVGRDNATLEKALATFDRLLLEYPDSMYTGAADVHKREVVERLAAYDENVMEFYRDQGNMPAYQARKKAYQEKWEPLLSKPKPVLDSDSSATDSEDEETQADPDQSAVSARAAVAESNSGQAAPLFRAAPAFVPKPESDGAPKPSAIRLDKVECDSDSGIVNLYFGGSSGKLPELNQAGANPVAEGVTFVLPGVSSVKPSYTCFAEDDLKISNDGTVTLSGVNALDLLVVGNPNRIVGKAEF